MSTRASKQIVRKAHRVEVARILDKVNALFLEEDVSTRRIRNYEAQLKEKVEILKTLDSEILEFLSVEGDEDACVAEVAEVSNWNEQINLALIEIADLSEDVRPMKRYDSVNSVKSTSSVNSTVRKIRARLPKLETKKFNGDVCEWQEFWDAFESAIHNNDELSTVDKFAYLRHLVEEPARKVIAGFRQTERDYESALECLKDRYAKPDVIKRAHINEMAATPTVQEDDVVGLRAAYDRIETHFRALEAMGVGMEIWSANADKNTFCKFCVLLRKNILPFKVQILIRILQPFPFHCTFHLSNLVNFLHTSLKFCILVRNFQYFPRFQNEDSIEKFLLVSEVSYF